jgi:hypothetical protein
MLVTSVVGVKLYSTLIQPDFGFGLLGVVVVAAGARNSVTSHRPLPAKRYDAIISAATIAVSLFFGGGRSALLFVPELIGYFGLVSLLQKGAAASVGRGQSSDQPPEEPQGEVSALGIVLEVSIFFSAFLAASLTSDRLPHWYVSFGCLLSIVGLLLSVWRVTRLAMLLTLSVLAVFYVSYGTLSVPNGKALAVSTLLVCASPLIPYSIGRLRRRPPAP